MSNQRKNIILVGFMGTGKTSAGKILAEKLDMEFLDMDEEIVRREGCSIPDIFRGRGEAAFRELERGLVQELAGRSNLVISTGGGIVLNPDNISDFSRTGYVFCLQAEPEEVLGRVGQDKNRPLLQVEDKLGRIRELLAVRRPLYDAISLQIDTAGHQPEDTVAAIIERIAEVEQA